MYSCLLPLIGLSMLLCLPVVIQGQLCDNIKTSCHATSSAGRLAIICESCSPLNYPSVCTLVGSDGALSFTCNAGEVVLTAADYPPGEYNLTLFVQDDNGKTAVVSLTFLQLTEPSPLIMTCSLGAEGLTLDCPTSLDDTMVFLTYSCSYDRGPAEDCGPGPEIPIAVDRYPAGTLVRLTVRVTTAGEQSDQDTLTLIVRDPVLRCTEKTLLRSISLNCRGVPFPASQASCSFDGMQAMPCNVSMIDIDPYSFGPDGHTLTIIYTDIRNNIGMSQYNFTGRTREPVSISLVGEDFVMVTEANLTLTVELAVTGLSFGVIPLRVVAVSYDGLEDLSDTFEIASSLEDIAGSNPLPMESAEPDLDFNGTLQTLEFTADLIPSIVRVYISLYSDGVLDEEEKGFVVLFGVLEDELEGRDRGSVTVLQQALLVSLQDGDSRFKILTGGALPGGREELLHYAARPGERVTIGVTEEMQTAIVERGAEPLLNFNYFFHQALSMGDQITSIVILRQLLDKLGRPLLGAEEEELSPSQGRIEVSVGGVSQQYYVRITGALVRDSGLYAIKVCSQNDTREVCSNATAILFVLDVDVSTSVPTDVSTTTTTNVTDVTRVAITTTYSTNTTTETIGPTVGNVSTIDAANVLHSNQESLNGVVECSCFMTGIVSALATLIVTLVFLTTIILVILLLLWRRNRLNAKARADAVEFHETITLHSV